MENSEQKTINSNKVQKVASVLMLEAGFEFAFLIAGPLIFGLFIGKWLDRKTHNNFYVIVGILLGLAISSFAIAKRVNEYKKILENKTK